MALRTILTDKDPALHKVCRPVTNFDQRLWDLLDDLKETLADAGGAGLAAPQVGILRRCAIVVDAQDQMLELVNPEIIWRSEELQDGWEGCLSVPGKWGTVERPMKVRVRAQDRNGAWFEAEGEAIVAAASAMSWITWTATSLPSSPTGSTPRRSWTRCTRRRTDRAHPLHGHARFCRGLPLRPFRGRP